MDPSSRLLGRMSRYGQAFDVIGQGHRYRAEIKNGTIVSTGGIFSKLYPQPLGTSPATM